MALTPSRNILAIVAPFARICTAYSHSLPLGSLELDDGQRFVTARTFQGSRKLIFRKPQLASGFVSIPGLLLHCALFRVLSLFGGPQIALLLRIKRRGPQLLARNRCILISIICSLRCVQ